MSCELIYSDEMLLLLMASDNQQAFTMLYRRYWQDLFVTAAKALRGKEEACDVVQEVFLSLWNRRHELNIEGSLAAYLHTSIRYKAIHYIEKKITRKDYLVLLTDMAVNNLAPSAEIQLQLKEVQLAIHHTIANMPPRMQEVFELSRQHSLSHKEIADRLGISVATVKKHIHHALQQIKSTLRFTSVILCFVASLLAK